MRIEFIYIIFLIGLNVSVVFSQDSLNVQDIEINNLKERINNLESEMTAYQVSRDFFNSILNSQTAIFSLIILILLASNFFMSRSAITSKVAKEIMNLKTDIESWEESSIKLVETKLLSRNEEIDKKIASRDAEIDRTLIALKADNFRSIAIGHKDLPSSAILWYTRSAVEYNIIEDTLMISNSLTLILLTLKTAKKGEFGAKDTVLEEYKEFIRHIDSAKYSDDLKNIETEIKRITQDDNTE